MKVEHLSYISLCEIHTDDFMEESLFTVARDMAKQRKRGASKSSKLGKHPKKKPIVVSLYVSGAVQDYRIIYISSYLNKVPFSMTVHCADSYVCNVSK